MLSPWRVVGAQVLVGVVAAAIGWLMTNEPPVALSALYGAAVVALPSALMARGATSRLGLVHPLASAASLLTWSVVKLAATVGLLIAAPRVVDALSWPVLLLTLVLCLQTYWLALLWRPAVKPTHPI